MPMPHLPQGTGVAERKQIAQVSALNEAVQGSAVRVLRPWQQRLEPPLPVLDSNDDDPELLIHIPFDGTVKLKVRRALAPQLV